MSSFTANFLKFLGNSTAMMLLFLHAVSAMHEEREISSSITASSVDPIEQERADSVANKSKVIAGLIREVEVLQAHEEDFIDLFKEDITPETIDIITKNIEENKKILLSLIETQTILSTLTPDKVGLSHVNKLNAIDSCANKVLKETLFLRVDFINARYNNNLLFHQHRHLKDVRILYGPTDPSLYDELTPEQKVLSQKAIDKYQTFNRVILGIASIVDLRLLPANTKMLLRASPTLYPLLEGNSKDLGHPDETFMLETIDGGPMKDREYLITHICFTEEVLLPDYSSFYKRIAKFYVSPYEKKSLEPTWQHPYALSELPYPEFLKPYPSAITASSSIVEKPKEERKRKGKGKRKRENKKQSLISPASSSISLSEPLADVHILVDLPLRPEIPEEAPLLVAGESSVVSPSTSTNSEPISTMPEERERDSSSGSSSSTSPLEEFQLEIAQPEENQTSEVAQIRPRGMRSFHGRAPKTTPPNQFAPLKGKHQKILERLFDSTRFSSVRYQDFAALWRSINGPDSIKNASSGGSHKALLDQSGKVVTGIFAHGEAQTFGKCTIMYIRDAFRQIGYGLER
ncbi:MAG: hypothetical protein K2X28_06695 [Alphaproteobacteria bacterium]|nr:hypothetical protein [Alphaproteobacteria bacterium]